MNLKKSWAKIIVLGSFVITIFLVILFNRQETLKKVIQRLSADSKIAQVLVTQVTKSSDKIYTTIKFLEFDSNLKPLQPKYFTFSGNIIQFQSLVVRFNDSFVISNHPLKGKSVFVFLKAFCIQNNQIESFDINKINEVPLGYKISNSKNIFEEKIWQKLWQYALDPQQANNIGIKSAQIEAPGVKFIQGLIYTIKIEHDGGMRIDVEKLPTIIDGEKISFQDKE